MLSCATADDCVPTRHSQAVSSRSIESFRDVLFSRWLRFLAGQRVFVRVIDLSTRPRSSPSLESDCEKKKKRGQLSRCGKDENSTNQGSACGPRWIGALHFSRHVPLTSAPRHTRFDPRDLPRPRTHTREMTGKNCENCNGAPAAWFCNSDGKSARGARASLFIFRGTRHFRSKTFPLWARTDR